MNFLKLVIVFIYLTSKDGSHGANILGIFPHYGISHWKVFEPLLEELDARGHHLVVVSPFPLGRNSSNYTHINTAAMLNTRTNAYMDFDRVLNSWQNAWARHRLLAAMAMEIEQCLGREEVQSVLNSTFDLALVELFNTEVFFSLIHKLNLPVVGLSSHALSPFINSIMSIPEQPSFIPCFMSTVSIPMNFIDRVQNTLEVLLSKLASLVFASMRSQTVAQSLLREALPDLTSVARNSTALTLVNSHFSIFGTSPFPQSVVEVGGLNVRPAKPLPERLQKIMNEAPEGVVYFSMGSALDSGMSEEKLRNFIRVFSELNQTILWKYGALSDTPANVHVESWFPQRDVLAHPNCVLFISHCGLLSINEAVSEAVPVVCFPIFGDQHFNAKNLQTTGMSVMLNYRQITYDTLKEELTRMLTDPIVKQKAKEVSFKFKDRPMPPLDTAVYWVEYAIRHGGARHLLSPARDLYWFQFYNIDVAITIASICICVVYGAYKLISVAVNLVSRRNSVVYPKIKNN